MATKKTYETATVYGLVDPRNGQKEAFMKPGYTHIAIVLDRSGSMEPVRTDTIGAFNTFVGDQQKVPGAATLTLNQFDDVFETVYDFVPLASVEPLSPKTFVPRGSTALFDAIGRTLNDTGARLAKMAEGDRPEKVLVVILTDGMENASREFNGAKVAEMIKHQREAYQWEIAFMGASEASLNQAASLGIARGSSLGYTATGEGVKSATQSLSRSVASYRSAPSSSPRGELFAGEKDEDKKDAKADSLRGRVQSR